MSPPCDWDWRPDSSTPCTRLTGYVLESRAFFLVGRITRNRSEPAPGGSVNTVEIHVHFEGVLLDLFGTLVPVGSRDDRAPHLHEMARLLEVDPVRFEGDWAKSLELRCSGQLGSLEECLRRIAGRQGIVPTFDHVRESVEVRLAFCQSPLESCGPVLPELDALRAAGVRLAVVSDTSGETPRLWPSTVLGQRFDATVFSCEEGFCKPDPRMYQRALQRLHLPAERCAFVGDGGSHELTGATTVGLAAFLYNFPGASPTPDARYDPDAEWNGPPLPDLRNLLTVTH
ncbi:MAG: HAD family hydrolase [Thermoplasmata archaeon]